VVALHAYRRGRFCVYWTWRRTAAFDAPIARDQSVRGGVVRFSSCRARTVSSLASWGRQQAGRYSTDSVPFVEQVIARLFSRAVRVTAIPAAARRRPGRRRQWRSFVACSRTAARFGGVSGARRRLPPRARTMGRGRSWTIPRRLAALSRLTSCTRQRRSCDAAHDSIGLAAKHLYVPLIRLRQPTRQPAPTRISRHARSPPTPANSALIASIRVHRPVEMICR